MNKRRLMIVVPIAAILFPYMINLIGWNIYAYFNFGEKDLIVATALGLSHNAWADHYDEDVTEDDGYPDYGLPDDFTRTVLDVGFLNLFIERRLDSMTPFTFRWFGSESDSGYRGFEFPWLLLLLSVPFAIFLRLKLLG